MTSTPKAGTLNRPASRQSTLKSFFTPPSNQNVAQPRTAPGRRAESPLRPDDSDDSDDLAALDQVMQRKRPILKTEVPHTPVTRATNQVKRQREEDPESLLYKGKYDLASLLAERTSRNDQKDKLARYTDVLDKSSIERATVKDERVQELLKVSKSTSSELSWQSFGDARTFKLSKSHSKQVHEISQGVKELDKMVESGLLMLAIRKGRVHPSTTLAEVLLHRLSTSSSIEFVHQCSRILRLVVQKHPCPDETIRTSFATIGLKSRNGNDSQFLTSSPAPLSSLLLLKIKSLLFLTTTPSRDLVLDILQLGLDSTYGPLLTTALESSLSSTPLLSKPDLDSISSRPQETQRLLTLLPSPSSTLALSFLPPDFLTIFPTTDYGLLSTQIAILDIATRHTNKDWVSKLNDSHGRIIDSKAAFMGRSEAKSRIQRLSDRLMYSSQSRRNVFDEFK